MFTEGSTHSINPAILDLVLGKVFCGCTFSILDIEYYCWHLNEGIKKRKAGPGLYNFWVMLCPGIHGGGGRSTQWSRESPVVSFLVLGLQCALWVYIQWIFV